MKSVFTRSAVGRRAAAGTVLALAAATLSFGLAGPASAIPPDIEGTVVGVGNAPVSDVCVDVYDASNDHFLQEVCTGVDGTYAFGGLGVSSVKLYFYDDSSFSYTGDTQYLSRWNNNARFRPNATPIAI